MRNLLISTLFCSVAFAGKLKVMIVDSGVDLKNPKLVKFIPKKYRKDMQDEYGHGTHVFGTIAKKACSQVELIPCKAFKGKYSTQFKRRDSLSCFRKAVALKVDIVNYSAGGNGFDKVEYRAVKALSDAGILFIAAAGNEGVDIGKKPFYPASYDLPNIIAVGALKSDGLAFSLSNTGSKVVWQEGYEVESDALGGGTVKMSGTSMAAATQTAQFVSFFCKMNK